jgi:hypothetical protein
MRPSVPRVVDPIVTMPERMLGGETQCVEGQAMGKEGEVVETRRWGRRAQRGGGHDGGQTGPQGRWHGRGWQRTWSVGVGRRKGGGGEPRGEVATAAAKPADKDGGTGGAGSGPGRSAWAAAHQGDADGANANERTLFLVPWL